MTTEARSGSLPLSRPLLDGARLFHGASLSGDDPIGFDPAFGEQNVVQSAAVIKHVHEPVRTPSHARVGGLKGRKQHAEYPV